MSVYKCQRFKHFQHLIIIVVSLHLCFVFLVTLREIFSSFATHITFGFLFCSVIVKVTLCNVYLYYSSANVLQVKSHFHPHTKSTCRIHFHQVRFLSFSGIFCLPVELYSIKRPCLYPGSTTFDRRHLTAGHLAAGQLTVRHLTPGPFYRGQLTAKPMPMPCHIIVSDKRNHQQLAITCAQSYKRYCT